MEQLLLVTSCDSPAGIGASLRTDERTSGRTDGWTHRRDVGNSILDVPSVNSLEDEAITSLNRQSRPKSKAGEKKNGGKKCR